MDNVELGPLRPLDDFLVGAARFQVPDVKDLDRWHNRIVSNLLYYQTNYILAALIIFLLVGVMHPVQMIFGFAAVVTSFVLFVVASNNQAELRRFKRNHSALSVAIILIMGYALIYFIGSVVVFLFGIALPLFAILVHASLRLRNMKNKVSAKIEYIGVKRTPMGMLLEALGLEGEAGS